MNYGTVLSPRCLLTQSSQLSTGQPCFLSSTRVGVAWPVDKFFSSSCLPGFPDQVELAPLPLWQPVGENLILRCQVAGGVPRDHLSVVLLRGEEELSRQLVVAEPAQVTATVLVGRGDHGANFSCRTELDLQSHGLGLFKNTSAPHQLQTFVLPMIPPRLITPRVLEVGMSRQVYCTLEGLFPSSEAQVQLALGDQMLNPAVTCHGDTLTAKATVTAQADQEGAQEIVCNVTLGGQTGESRKNLTVFSFLGPILNLSEPSAPEGSTVTVICMAGARVQVVLDGVPAAAPGQPAQLQLNATESDDQRSFFCSATLEVDGEIFNRNTSVQLRVLYGPKIDRANCPERWKWKDKTMQILQCQARGNPAPQLHCLQEGSRREVPIGIPFFVNLKYNGTYYCQAASSRGTYTLIVVMDVQNRNSPFVNIFTGVLVIVGVVTVAVASKYLFGKKKRSGFYKVKQESTSLPLTSMQLNQAVGEEPS
ncbi:intercellular adhesion molecule 3 isoform X2 [Otolemur garnettii]|uniref:intercellular adhesion molecule 3 isoform X2 n=1 Tax=Otolemur garnettii TaxID=30611 RepID=UPI000C7F46E8|nr:intercellular adhesion molecule 3 isoform X2 [Otolemur garnettii]